MFHLKGEQINRPVQLRKLPLQLYRDQNYPGDPAFMARESQRYLAGDPPPIYVPTRMYYTQWTRAHDAFGANTVAMLAALKQGRDQVSALHGAGMSEANGQIPVSPARQSADAITGSNLPTLSRLSSQDYSRVPLAHNALPLSGFLSASEISDALATQTPIP